MKKKLIMSLGLMTIINTHLRVQGHQELTEEEVTISEPLEEEDIHTCSAPVNRVMLLNDMSAVAPMPELRRYSIHKSIYGNVSLEDNDFLQRKINQRRTR